MVATPDDLDVYFDAVVGQHLPLFQRAAAAEGPGIVAVHFCAPPKADGTNCRIRYCERGGKHWEFLANLAPDVVGRYRPDAHLLIAVLVPANEYNSEVVGGVRLYDAASGRPVP